MKRRVVVLSVSPEVVRAQVLRTDAEVEILFLRSLPRPAAVGDIFNVTDLGLGWTIVEEAR